ncbi:hypothetical protein ANTHONY_138 [Bacillus phage Anthony]|uniref:Uncharacterized protein n=1 Tax=Bacillus phage Anthony TaxID=2024253 RepID=A0A223LFQ4_9CAUD|nr:hypothetical protein ANTHONY_138 [Bacillus phage Anthony]
MHRYNKLILEVLVIGDELGLAKGERYPVCEISPIWDGWISIQELGYRRHMHISNKNIIVYGKGVR